MSDNSEQKPLQNTEAVPTDSKDSQDDSWNPSSFDIVAIVGTGALIGGLGAYIGIRTSMKNADKDAKNPDVKNIGKKEIPFSQLPKANKKIAVNMTAKAFLYGTILCGTMAAGAFAVMANKLDAKSPEDFVRKFRALGQSQNESMTQTINPFIKSVEGVATWFKSTSIGTALQKRSQESLDKHTVNNAEGQPVNELGFTEADIEALKSFQSNMRISDAAIIPAVKAVQADADKLSSSSNSSSKPEAK